MPALVVAHEFEQVEKRGVLTTQCKSCGVRVCRSTGMNAAGFAYATCGHAEKWLKHVGIELKPYASRGFFLAASNSYRVVAPDGRILGHVGRRMAGSCWETGTIGYRSSAGKWVPVRYASEAFAALQLLLGRGYDKNSL